MRSLVIRFLYLTRDVPPARGGCPYLVFGEAEDLVVRAVEYCWNSWKTRFSFSTSSNGFHQPVLGLGGPGGKGVKMAWTDQARQKSLARRRERKLAFDKLHWDMAMRVASAGGGLARLQRCIEGALLRTVSVSGA